MAEVMLKDLTLWHWWFFLRSHSREHPDHLPQHWQDFSAALDSAVQWAGGWQVSVQARPDRLPPARQTSVRLASLPWRESDGAKRTLEARAMLDVFYIQSGCAQEGAAGTEAVLRLKGTEWQWQRDAHSFLGDAVCLEAELKRAEEKKAEVIAQALSARWLGKPVRQVELVELDCCFFATPVGIEEEVWVMLVRDKDEARQQSAHFVHRLMPPLLLARLKGRVMMQEFEKHVTPRAQELEGQLGTALTQIEQQPRRLKVLEQSSEMIARHQMELTKELDQCEEVLETLRVNAANIERLLDDSLLAPQRAALDELLAAPLRQSVDQVATDLRYLSITQAQADRMLHGIGTMAEVRSGRFERILAILFGLFAFFELFHAFPELHEHIPVGWRIGLVLAGLIIIGGIILVLSRKK
jgi:hypothetical protein